MDKIKANYKVRQILKQQKESNMSETNNRTYRRIVIINKKTEAIILDKLEVGPMKSESHLREVFANTPTLKKVKGDDLEVKTMTIVEFCSSKGE